MKFPRFKRKSERKVDAHGGDVSTGVVQRLLEHSDTYCIARVPESEPEPEELPQAELAQDEGVVVEEVGDEPAEGEAEEEPDSQ